MRRQSPPVAGDDVATDDDYTDVDEDKDDHPVAAAAAATAGVVTTAEGIDRAALAAAQMTSDALERGTRAALAVWAHADGAPHWPCAWCCAQSRTSQPAERHGPASCFIRTCMVCVRPSSYKYVGKSSPLSPQVAAAAAVERSPSTAAAAAAVAAGTCGVSSRVCKTQPPPWSRDRRGHGDGGFDTRCHACFLPRTIRSVDGMALDSHPLGRFGPARCPWVFVIKVALLQVAMARSFMSPDKREFAPALAHACAVTWATQSDSSHDGCQAVASAVSERNIPRRLLDWGPADRPSAVDKVAKWLSGGTRLPNVVLFAPILARAFGLSF